MHTPRLSVYDTHWFVEQRDADGRWHTIADSAFFHAQRQRLGPHNVESLNLQWQFVRDTILDYEAWAGWREGSAQRWPPDVSTPARTWLARLLAHIAEIPTLPYTKEDGPIPVPRHSYGVVGPGVGLQKAWPSPKALQRFLARVAQARADLGCATILTEHGWDTLNGHARLHAAHAAHNLLPPSERHTRMVFSTKA